jgi:hypothetical protein
MSGGPPCVIWSLTHPQTGKRGDGDGRFLRLWLSRKSIGKSVPVWQFFFFFSFFFFFFRLAIEVRTFVCGEIFNPDSEWRGGSDTVVRLRRRSAQHRRHGRRPFMQHASMRAPKIMYSVLLCVFGGVFFFSIARVSHIDLLSLVMESNLVGDPEIDLPSCSGVQIARPRGRLPPRGAKKKKESADASQLLFSI